MLTGAVSITHPRPLIPHVEAKHCCIQALQATAQQYSAEEVAVRAVPALAPLCVDPIAQVRQWPILATIHGPNNCADLSRMLTM